jgi:hypothetical protein
VRPEKKKQYEDTPMKKALFFQSWLLHRLAGFHVDWYPSAPWDMLKSEVS